MDYLVLMRKIQYAVIFIDFAIALVLFLRFKFTRYILILFIYIAVISAITAARFILSEELGNKLYYVSALAHFSLLAILFLNIDTPDLRNFKTLTFSISWFILLFSLLVSRSHKEWLLIGAFSNTGIFALAAYYYYKMFSSTKPVKIFSVPAFWIVTGIFICKSIALPMIAFFYLLNSKNIVDNETINNLFSIGAFGYIVMHLFFIGGFACFYRGRNQSDIINL